MTNATTAIARRFLLAAILVLAPCGAFAQVKGKPPKVSELLARIEEQQKEIEAQRALLATQSQQITAQDQQIAAQDKRLEEMNKTLQELALQVAQQAQAVEPTPQFFERLSALEQTVKEKPDLPPDMVTAGDFPGSIRVPGSTQTFKIGGYVRSTLIQTLSPLGSDDRFLTNSIPVGEEESGQVTRFQTSVRPSAINFEFRTPTQGVPLRAFVEGDFASTSGNDFRLRHAYIQFDDFLAGQTWSTFSDLEAEPEGVDFEGLNAINILRQTQFRWTPAIGSFGRLAIAVEDADASITGGTGANRYPDLIFGRRQRFEKGHLFLALSLRDIRGQLASDPTLLANDLGWAVTVSGRRATSLAEGDEFRFQATIGEGSARYINDLNSLGGQDAVFDENTKRLEALPAMGAYFAYEHHWGSWRWLANMRSTGVVGMVYVNNKSIQPADAYHSTGRLTLNFLTSPFPTMNIGVEFIAGRRVNKDKQHGTSGQVQMMAQYRF